MTLTEVGGQFEFDWMWYVQSQGYLVRQAVPVTTEGNVEDATDIDVWGVKFLPPLRQSTTVVDCKNRTRSKPYERILWAKGMASYVGADHAFVGLPKATWKAIDFGHRGGICVVPYDTIRTHLSALPPGRQAYGQASMHLYQHFFAIRKTALRADKLLPIRLFEARSYFRIGSPFTKLNRIATALNDAAERMRHAGADESRRTLWLFTCCELIAAFAVNVMRAAQDSFLLAPGDRRGLVAKRLTYGDMPAEKADEIVRLSSKLALAYAQEALPIEDRAKLSAGPIDRCGLPPPDYSADVAGLLERVVAAPMIYWDGVRVLDAMLFGHSVHLRPVERGDMPRAESGGDFADVLKAAKNLLVLACDAAEIDRRPFWPDRSSGPTLFPESDASGTPNVGPPAAADGKESIPEATASPEAVKK